MFSRRTRFTEFFKLSSMEVPETVLVCSTVFYRINNTMETKCIKTNVEYVNSILNVRKKKDFAVVCHRFRPSCLFLILQRIGLFSSAIKIYFLHFLPKISFGSLGQNIIFAVMFLYLFTRILLRLSCFLWEIGWSRKKTTQTVCFVS